MSEMPWPTARALRRWWRPLRVVTSFAMLAVACWVVLGKSSELSGAGAFLAQPRWAWLAMAAAVELCSYMAMAALQRSLLRSGKTYARLGRVTLITFSSNAIQSALPAGAAFGAVYQFRQYELLGADDVLAGWVVIATGAVAFSTLAALAGVGLALAASTGSTFDLVEAVLGVIVIALLVVIAWSRRAHVYSMVLRLVILVERRTRRLASNAPPVGPSTAHYLASPATTDGLAPAQDGLSVQDGQSVQDGLGGLADLPGLPGRSALDDPSGLEGLPDVRELAEVADLSQVTEGRPSAGLDRAGLDSAGLDSAGLDSAGTRGRDGAGTAGPGERYAVLAHGPVSGPLARGLERMHKVAPNRRQWATAIFFGTALWLTDCACLMFSFLAVGAGVPWQGLLLAYCGGQLAVSLPITPGGLGVVEGSLTVALVAFGGGQAVTVAAVLLYRLISFWIPLPVGAGCYAALARARRRSRGRSASPGETRTAPSEGNVGWAQGGTSQPAGPTCADEDSKRPEARAVKAQGQQE